LRASLTDELIALEIDDGEVRMAVAAPDATGYVVRGYRRDLAPDSVRSGCVLEFEPVVDAVSSLIAASETRAYRVSLLFGAGHTLCRVETLANADDHTAVAECEERMQRYIVFGGQPIVVAHSLQMGSEEGDRRSRLVSAGVLHSVVSTQTEALTRCGLEVVRIEPVMVAAARMMLLAERPERPRFVLVAQTNGCEIGLLRHDGLVFCHRLAVGADTLATDGVALKGTLDEIAEFHLRHASNDKPVEELLCCGSESRLEALFGRLGEAGLRASWLDPSNWPHVARFETPDAEAADADRAALAPAVGEALAEALGPGVVGRLHLMPPNEQKGRPKYLPHLPWWVRAPLGLASVAAVVLTVCVFVVHGEAGGLSRLLNRPTSDMRECSRLLRRASELREFQQQVAALPNRVTRSATPLFLEELPRRLPEGAWLDQVVVLRTGQCAIDGFTHVEDSIHVFVQSLRCSPYVERVQLNEAETRREGQFILMRFQIEVELGVLRGSETSRAEQ